MSLTGDPLTDRMVPVAVRLVGAVRESDMDEVEASFAEAKEVDQKDGLFLLAVVLAAMVPYDRSPRDLLGWFQYRNEFERLVAIGIDPATAATVIEKLRNDNARPQQD